MAVLLSPVVFAYKTLTPTATFCDPVVLVRNAALPTAVVLLEEVFDNKDS